MDKGKVKAVFFNLLRSGLWSLPLNLEAGLPLSADEWKYLYRTAIAQTVEGILYDAVERLPKEMLPPRSLLVHWVVRIEKIEQRNKFLNRIIAEQTSYFNKMNLKPVLLKGQGIAACYANPLRRLSGDIDWYFGEEKEYKLANQMIAKQSIKMDQETRDSACYEWRGCEIDHHRRLFDIHNPFLKRYLKRLECRYRVEHVLIEGQVVYTLSPMLNILQVNVHILKHLLSYGIGLRQLCDAARLYYTHSEKLKSEELHRIYEDVGVLNWMYSFHEVLSTYIGLPLECIPFSTKKQQSVDWIIEEIWQTGNFGFHDTRYGDDPETKETRKQAIRRIGKNIYRYFKYAPMEAIWFPIMQVHSRYF